MKKTLVFMGGIHGDEITGIKVIKKLKKYFEKNKQNINVKTYFGNPKAIKENKRFIDADLNRCFGENKNPKNYEEKRAIFLKKKLEKTDYLVDIHSTILDSKSFCIIFDKKNQMPIAEIFETDFIVSTEKYFGKINKKIFTLDRFIASKNKIGLTIETGQKDNTKNINLIFEQCLNLVNKLDFKTPKKNKKPNSNILEVYDEKIAKTDNFTWTIKPKNFLYLKANTIIGKDNTKNIFIKKDSYLIFPKLNPKKNMRICLLAN